MSKSAAGARLTLLHRRRQLALRAASLRDLLRLWPLWRGDPKSWDEFASLVITMIQARRQDSAGIAVDYYEAFRKAEGIPGVGTPRIAGPADVRKLLRSLTSTGLVGVVRASSAGQSPQAAMQNGLVRLSGAVGRHVLDGGRVTLLQSTRSDRWGKGWQRVTGGAPCSYCEKAAGTPMTSEEVFASHDGCACTAEPRF